MCRGKTGGRCQEEDVSFPGLFHNSQNLLCLPDTGHCQWAVIPSPPGAIGVSSELGFVPFPFEGQRSPGPPPSLTGESIPHTLFGEPTVFSTNARAAKEHSLGHLGTSSPGPHCAILRLLLCLALGKPTWGATLEPAQTCTLHKSKEQPQEPFLAQAHYKSICIRKLSVRGTISEHIQTKANCSCELLL